MSNKIFLISIVYNKTYKLNKVNYLKVILKNLMIQINKFRNFIELKG